MHELFRDVPVGSGGRGRREGLRRREARRACYRWGRARCSRTSASAPRTTSRSPSRRPPRRRRPGRGLGAGPASAAPTSSARSARATTSSRSRSSTAIYDADAAEAFGLRQGQITVLIHSGSRGLGYQVCDDFVKRMDARLCALRHRAARPPARLRAGRRRPRGATTSRAMAAAANFAWRNRAGARRTRPARRSRRVLGPAPPRGTRLVYDVAHNIAKFEAATAGRDGLRAPQGRDPRLPAGPSRDPAAYARSASR